MNFLASSCRRPLLGAEEFEGKCRCLMNQATGLPAPLPIGEGGSQLLVASLDSSRRLLGDLVVV